MDEYLKSLQEKYGYSEELKETLRKIISAFIEHYGQENEQLILDAISSCKIHLKQDEKEDTYKYMSEYFPDKEVEEMPIIASCLYDSMPIINNDTVDAKRLIYIGGDIDLQREKTISDLVHEIGHLIKSYNNEYKIVDGEIQERSGISIIKIDKNEETGKYFAKENSNNGLEEAINCYDEEIIMTKITGRKFFNDSYYHVLNNVINPIFAENNELLQTFRNAQLKGTDEHIKLLGEEKFRGLSENFDNLLFTIMHLGGLMFKYENKTPEQIVKEEEEKVFKYYNENIANKEQENENLEINEYGETRESKMDITNIALVRATNTIPFDGIVHPISKVPYIKKLRGTAFANAINDLLKKESIINLDGFWNKTEEEQEQVIKQNKEILEKYLPYSSDYNSMVLWSLNGLVPDDMNNTFSNKTCAIIEGLREQIDNSEIVSLVPTDTAIKGDVKLSNQAIILINKDRYETLSEYEKEQLENLDLDVKIFEGDLQEEVNKTLERSRRYTAEELSLNRENNGYLDSDTKEELVETIHNIAENHNIAQVLHFDVITGQNDELEKLENVKDEFDNSMIVSKCYQKTFLQYLFSKINIDKKLCENIINFMDSSVYMKQLCDEIEKIGLDKYENIVNQFNKSIEKLKEEGKLPTPEEIVSLSKENKDFTLNFQIENEEFIITEKDIEKVASNIDTNNKDSANKKAKENLQKMHEIQKNR